MSLVEIATGFSARLDSHEQWTLSGALDLLSAPEMVEFARSAPSPDMDLTVWVHDLTFMDVAGWRALQEAHEIVGRHRSMRLIGSASPVALVVAILGAP